MASYGILSEVSDAAAIRELAAIVCRKSQLQWQYMLVIAAAIAVAVCVLWKEAGPRV